VFKADVEGDRRDEGGSLPEGVEDTMVMKEMWVPTGPDRVPGAALATVPGSAGARPTVSLPLDDLRTPCLDDSLDGLAEYSEPFEAFYRRTYGRVVAVAHSMTGSRHVGEEIAQEAFISAHRNWAKVSRLERPDLWVRRVAINRCTSRWRRLLVELRSNKASHDDRSRSVDTSDAAEAIAARDALWDAVRTLPDRQTAVVVLHYVDELTTAEIGELLDLSASTVQTHLARARERLAALLAGPDSPTITMTEGAHR